MNLFKWFKELNKKRISKENKKVMDQLEKDNATNFKEFKIRHDGYKTMEEQSEASIDPKYRDYDLEKLVINFRKNNRILNTTDAFYNVNGTIYWGILGSDDAMYHFPLCQLDSPTERYIKSYLKF